MPRKVDLIAESPILQAGKMLQQDLGSAATQIKETYRKAAVGKFLEGISMLNKPKDFKKKQEKLQEISKMYEGLPQSSDPVVLAAQVQARSMKVQALEAQDLLEEEMRNDLKEQYVNQNLGLFSQLSDGEKSAVAYAFPKAASALQSFSHGGGFGGYGGMGGTKNKKLETFTIGGKDVVGSFDETTGTFTPIRESLSMKEMAENVLKYSGANKNNADAYQSMMAAKVSEGQSDKLLTDGLEMNLGNRLVKVRKVPPQFVGREEEWARAMSSVDGLGIKNVQPVQLNDGSYGVRYEVPMPMKSGGGGGGSKVADPVALKTAQTMTEKDIMDTERLNNAYEDVQRSQNGSGNLADISNMLTTYKTKNGYELHGNNYSIKAQTLNDFRRQVIGAMKAKAGKKTVSQLIQ
jgi:hypothetical protein